MSSSHPHQLFVDFWKCWQVRRWQCIELVWWTFILISFSGQLHPNRIWDIPYSLGPSSFVEAGVSAHGWSAPLLHCSSWSLSAWGSHFLKPTPWMHLWMLMVYFLVTTSLVAEQPFFLPPFVGVMSRPGWKEGAQGIMGRGKAGL